MVISGISCCVGVASSCSNSESVEISVAEFSMLSSVDASSDDTTYKKQSILNK